jgi:ssDNA-binding Zn-finger/Zn-ribbon topoisomerase 1
MASKETIRKVRSEIHFECFQENQDILKKKLEEDGCKNIPKYICPTCNKELIVRLSSINAEKFWGCSAFPSCRYTDTFYGEKFPELA